MSVKHWKAVEEVLLAGRNFSGNKLEQNWQEFSSNVPSNLFQSKSLTKNIKKI